MIDLWLATIFTALVISSFAILIGRHLPFTFFLPVYGIPAVYGLIGLTGYCYYKFGKSYIGGFYDIGVSESQLAQGFAGFIGAIGAFLLGALVYLLFSSRLKQVKPYSPEITSKNTKPNSRPAAFAPGVLSLLILTLPLFLVIIGVGPANVLSRTEYLVTEFHYVQIMGGLLSMPALLALGFLTPAKKSRFWVAACLIVFATYELILLSLSTRRIVVIFLFYVVGLALGGGRRRIVLPLLAVWGISLPLLLQVPLGLRGMPTQGLLPLWGNLVRIGSSSSATLYVEGVNQFLSNATFGVPLTGYVKNAKKLPADVLIMSVQPLPSFISLPELPSSDQLLEIVRVNGHIPYNTLGELLNFGWLWLLTYYLVVGIVAAWIDVNARFFQGRRSRWGFLVACGMLFFFSLNSTQYNLRAASRYIYYALAVAVAWRLICRVKVRT